MKILIISTLKLLLLNSVASHNIVLAHNHNTPSKSSSQLSVHEHKAHQHGYIELTMIIEGNNLMVQLLSPADSLLGFEHQAATEQEIAKLSSTKKQLSSSSNILKFNNVDCQLEHTSVDTYAIDPSTPENKKNHSRVVQSHTEITVNYQFTCKSIAKISSISIELFKHYPAVEQVRAIWIHENKQGSYLLTPSKNVLTLN